MQLLVHFLLVLLILILLLCYRHALSQSQLPHLVSNSLFILEFMCLQPMRLLVLHLLLLFDLLPESLPHGLLFCLSLILNDLLFVSALDEDVALPLQLQINSVLDNSTPNFHLWKISLRYRCIKVRVVLRVLVVHIKCLIVGIESIGGLSLGLTSKGCLLLQLWIVSSLYHLAWLLLIDCTRGYLIWVLLRILLRIYLCKLSGPSLAPLLLLSEEVSLLDLLCQLVGELPLLLFSLQTE